MLFFTFKNWKDRRKRGETLVEILIALFTLSIGAAAATGLILIALQTNSDTKDSLIAQNLAREGIEAVRNIRDSNWVKWGKQAGECWDLIEISDCFFSPQKIGDEKFYRVAIDQGLTTTDVAAFQWKLAQQPGNKPLDLSNGNQQAINDFYRLSIVDRFANVDSNKDQNMTNDLDLYAHVYPTSSKKTPFVGTPVDSKFYRMIFIDHDSQNDPMRVYSVVEWKDGSQTKRIELVTTLDNYKKDFN